MNSSNETFVFIDERVAERETLLTAFGNDSRWALVDAGDDGLQQINAHLAGENAFASLRIIAHGQPGSLHLGNNALTGADLARQADTLAAIGRALDANGDVQIYACELGHGRAGRAFVAELAARLGVAVAAASTPVGHAELGGDWRLDVGQTRTPPLDVPQWPGRLGITVVRLPNTFPGHSPGEWRNSKAFAALRADGSVVTWGDAASGGDSSTLAVQLGGARDVTQIFSTTAAFAALRSDGSVVTWGNAASGGDSSSVAAPLDGTRDVTHLYSTRTAFAALRADGSVVTWGDAASGGNSSALATQLDGSIDVTQLYSTASAFAALRADGSLVTWGNAAGGGDSSTVSAPLDGTLDIVQVAATHTAFAALRADGSVVTWGNAGGGNSSSVAA